MSDWDWIVGGYRGGKLITETVHRGDSSKDTEVMILKKSTDIDRVDVRPWVLGDPNPWSDWERMERKRTQRRRRKS